MAHEANMCKSQMFPGHYRWEVRVEKISQNCKEHFQLFNGTVVLAVKIVFHNLFEIIFFYIFKSF